MANVSPGVFTKIIDLSTYVQAVPSTIAFLCGFSKKGRDNEVINVGSRADFTSEWGEPYIKDFGKYFGQGPYVAYNYLGESGALYWMRCLPDDAAFSNIRLDVTTTESYVTTDTTTANCVWSSIFNNSNYTAGADTTWDTVNGRWATTDSTSPVINLTIGAGQTWNDGLRSTHIRVTGNVTEIGQVVYGLDSTSNYCLPEQPNSPDNSTGVARRSYIFEWSNDADLASLSLGGYSYITEIEYLNCDGTSVNTVVPLETNDTNFTAGDYTVWDATAQVFYSTNPTTQEINIVVNNPTINTEQFDALWFVNIMDVPSMAYVYDTQGNIVGRGLSFTSTEYSGPVFLLEIDWSLGYDIDYIQFIPCTGSCTIDYPEEGIVETCAITVTHITSLNSETEITSNLVSSGTTTPLCFLVPIGRGSWYNKIGVRITQHSNPMLWQTYVLDVYEKQSDGDDVIIESFVVSFDPAAKDSAGDSLWIADVLETYSNVLRCYLTLSNGDYTDGVNLISRVYDKNIGTVSATLTSASITDNKQDFSAWETESGTATYITVVKDGKGNEIWGWLGAAGGVDGETVDIYTDSSLTTQGWNGSTSSFDVNSTIEYQVRKNHALVSDYFTSSEPVPLRRGSDGSLYQADGTLDTSEAETLLEQGYSGLIDDVVLDTENIYFSLVYDAGYPADVKTAISTLCQTRRDCVGILDNGDNSTVNIALATRTNTNTFNNFYVALYEGYNKVSDAFSGEDIWFSPVYHMAYLIPRNDNVAELWFAVAGFNRAAIDTIKELRYNPTLSQRDSMYLKQLNPIVKFSQGYVVWGQLTSQSKASALQDLNIVRLVLYCKKAIEQFCRFFIFEQNDIITWSQVASNIVDFLEVIKNKRGLDSYNVEVSATDYERRTKKFHVNITLQPTRVVEQIELNFFIQ